MAKRLDTCGSVSLGTARRWAASCALMSLLCSNCWAALGGDLVSVQNDAQAFGASSNSSQLAGATRYTQALSNGVMLRQYVDAAGLVFALAWDGPVLPDFERLLGPYFQAYTAAARQQKRGVSVQEPGVVIESGGMMRSFSGRAYLPGKLPATWNAQDIR